MLEWHLPWWLGERFGLDEQIADDLVVGNVLGLGSIRLRDDLADGEVSAEETRSAVALSESLYALAVDQFRRHLPATSPFWGYLETCMRAWRESTGHMDADRLAARGAP